MVPTMRPQMMKDYCSIYSVSPPEVQSHRTIRSSICLASATLSAIVAVSRGDDLLMSSLANRTVTMMGSCNYQRRCEPILFTVRATDSQNT